MEFSEQQNFLKPTLALSSFLSPSLLGCLQFFLSLPADKQGKKIGFSPGCIKVNG